MSEPGYPVYVISKGRARHCLTARFMAEDRVPFQLVVEPQEADAYRECHGDHVSVLPFSNLGQGSTPARNWCWDDAKAKGTKRHWIFDDNITSIIRLNRGKRIRCNAALALSVLEDFTDRYANVAISGLNYTMFVTNQTPRPFVVNCHVYSALLIDNAIPYRWRLRYNEDTDLCLQVVTNGLCTVLFNAFSIQKVRTMVMKGGNSDGLYGGVQKDPQDRATRQRLIMARALEEVWPDHVEVRWRFGRAQHVVKNNWKHFTHPLVRRSDVDWSAFRKIDNRGMTLREVDGPPKSPELRELLAESREAEERALASES